MNTKIGAVAFAALLSLAVSASAGTYEDKVFRPGEPRWGSSPRHYEDRNVQRTRRVIVVRSQAPCCEQRTVVRRVIVRRAAPVRKPCCVVARPAPVRAPCCVTTTSAVPVQSANAIHRVARCIGWQDGKFWFIDEVGVKSWSTQERRVGQTFRVVGGQLLWL